MKQKEQREVSRRSFVKGLGIGLAAPLIVPAAALGKDANTAPNERITVAAIGTGNQGRGLIGGVLQQKEAHVIALCDVNKNNLKEAKDTVDKHYGQSTDTYHDFRELLARKDIDAVIIATPDHWHAIICIQAAKAGKDIYCEKPLTYSLGEGRAVVKAVKENNTIFQVGSMQRSSAQMKQACHLVRNGYLGKIHHIDVGLPDGGHHLWVDSFPQPPEWVDYEFWVGPAEWAPYHPERLDWNWRWWMGFGGGQMMDWIGHHADIAHMGMGWDDTGPSEIEPVLWELPKEKSNLYDAPEHYQMNYTYADGATMQLASFKDTPKLFQECGETGTQWFGEDGQWVYVSRGGIKASPKSLLKIKHKDGDFRFRRERNHMRDFLDCVKTRKQPIAHVEAGHRSASIGHLGKLASMLGCPLKWDPAAERIIDNDAVNNLLTRKYRSDWSLE